MLIYFRLFLVALVPAFLSCLIYLLKRRTRFGLLPYALQQTIIGLVFGAAAIFGTEFGVDVGGATANARDAAPLCAGLLFGAPAGILACVIGGVERWFAALWGAGYYSRLACSLSTLLSGMYAAALRKYLFDNKRPTAGFGIATAVVMEVFHLSVLFLTHLSDATKAYEIVKITTLPMILCNAISVALAIFLLQWISRGIHRGEKKRIRTIAQKVQTRMLVCVVLAYVFTTGFVYILQTNTALVTTKNLLSVNLEDVQSDLQKQADSRLLASARSVRDKLAENPQVSLTQLAETYQLCDIHVIGPDNTIRQSTHADLIGLDITSNEPFNVFTVLNGGTAELVQDYREISYRTEETPIFRKYAGCALPTGGYVQVGYDAETFQQNLSGPIAELTQNRHIGESGYLLILDSNGQPVNLSGEASGQGRKTAVPSLSKDTAKNEMLHDEIAGTDSYWMLTSAGPYSLIAVLPTKEAFATRDAAVYVNSYMEVLVFAALFLLIYRLLKKQVVNNIRTVNANLKKIIGGNLNVSVQVRSSEEFSSLSDDINSTVTTLKRYIDEAAARIDRELEFAKAIQISALPSRFPAFPETPEVDLYATMATAKEVGGDFYDFYTLSDGRVAFLIADVSGKGIPAALFMMRAKTMLKNLTEEGLSVDEVMTRANTGLCEGNDAGMFVTAWLGVLETDTGHVTFANAGHNPPILCHTNGTCEYLTGRAGLVLAGMEGIVYKKQELDLCPGDRLYLYTDGVTEATDAQKQLYGEKRLLAFIEKHTQDTVSELLPAVKADLDAFVGEAEQFDDITMLALDYFGKQE